MRSSSRETPKNRFREIPPLPQWSATLQLDIPYAHFAQTTMKLAAANRHRYTGLVTRDNDTNNVTSFTHTTYPRRKYGPQASPEIMHARLAELGKEFNTGVRPDPQRHSGFSRIILGLYIGQHEQYGKDEPDHSIEEITAHLGNDFTVTPGEVFTVRFGETDVHHYSEPIANSLGLTALNHLAYETGEAFGQERFTIESFMENGGRAYVVETVHCKEPDPPAPGELI